MGILDRLAHAWNAFVGIDPPTKNGMNRINYETLGPGSYYRPDRVIIRRGNEKSIVGAIYNRIAIDCSSIVVKHVKLDKEGRYISDVDSLLNQCLTVSSNIDQTPRMLLRDIIISMFDEGCVAVVPVDTDRDPEKGEPGSFDVESLRVGKITQWYPKKVKVELYNDNTGNMVELILPKEEVAIIENPLYAIMNEPNSTLQRLIRKLNLLDVIDEQSGSGKLDLIVQLPYTIKSEQKRQEAMKRKKDIENQLAGSKYGIAYIDSTEKVTQLNRSLENNLLDQVQFLTSTLESQLGIDEKILNGTADEKEYLNYLNQTIRPIMDVVVDEYKRKFLTKTARTQGQTIMYFTEPFKLVPVANMADIADKFTRNEILSPNEIRQIVGFKPVNDPKADELRNRNLNESKNQDSPSTETGNTVRTNKDKEGGNQNA